MEHTINKEQLPIEELARLSITIDRLEKTHNLSKILNFDKTSLLNLSGEINGIPFKADGKISLIKGLDNKYHVKMHLIKRFPDIKAPIYGAYLDETQKQCLLDTGHAGSPIAVKKHDGTMLRMLVSIDKDTNQISAFSCDRIDIKEEICGRQISAEEREKLSNGESIYMEGLKKKDGTIFATHVVFCADKKSLAFVNNPNIKKQGLRQAQTDSQTAEVKHKSNQRPSL